VWKSLRPNTLRAVILSHLPFENLGSLEPELARRSFGIEIVDVTTANFPVPEIESCDLLVVLGGPIGVYDTHDFPSYNR
jgi:GMP synthase (glutamine-hydrolysing)